MKKFDPDKTLFLVDISSFIFRAFFAIRYLSNSKGEPTNAVFGVANMLGKLFEEGKPKHLAVAYDSKGDTFREEIYEDYKANRDAPPDDLIPQFARIDELVEKMKIPSFRMDGVEADDIIASLTKNWIKKSKKHHVVIVSGDKDLMQLVDGQVQVWDTMKQKWFGEEEVEEKFGVRADQVRDYLALVGDTSDNVPGVPSIGPKSASTLLQEYKDLKGVIQAAKAGKIKGKKSQVISEHEDQALMSQELVTLKDDLKVEVEKDQEGFEFVPDEELLEYLKELEFDRLAERWQNISGVETQSKESSSQKDVKFETVWTEKQLKDLVLKIEKMGEFGFDLETTSLEAVEAKIVGVAISLSEKDGFYIPVGHRVSKKDQLETKKVLRVLKPVLENPKIKKVGQNLKYDFSVLYQYDIEPQGLGADTMIASFVLDSSGRHNLDTISQKYLDHRPISYEEVCGKGKDQIGFDQVPVEDATKYAAEDAWIAYSLWKKLQPRLEEDHLLAVFSQVELPLVSVLAKMECNGVCVDTGFLAKLSKKFASEVAGIEEHIQSFTKDPVNLNSPKQLSKLLFEDLKLPVISKTKTGYSTDAKVLEKLKDKHEVPRLLLEYREISKLKSTYVDPLPKLISEKTGRIHAGFHQTVAATGRLSSSNPNLQNIPIRTDRGRLIRKAFIPSEGNLLVSADYSQVELRILAHMSGDSSLCRAFNEGEDVHRRTASEIFDVSPDKVDDSQRAAAKAINFGLMYGKTPFGLSQELGITRAEATSMIENYFERYSKVKSFLDDQIEKAKKLGYTETLMGRRRPLPELQSSNKMVQANGERMAMNSPIQGTAAELMKVAMIDLQDALEESGSNAKMIVQVHDELLLDCPKKEVPQVKKLLQEKLENAIDFDVPMLTNAAVGENWMELK